MILGFDFRKGSLGFSFSVKNRIVHTCGLKLLQQVGLLPQHKVVVVVVGSGIETVNKSPKIPLFRVWKINGAGWLVPVYYTEYGRGAIVSTKNGRPCIAA